MEQLNYEQLFLVRHGHYKTDLSKRLTEKGVAQIERTAKLISPLLNSNTYITPFASTQRRAIESLFVLQDNLIIEQGERKGTQALLSFVFTDLSVCGEDVEDFERFIGFTNEYKRSKICLAATHMEMIERFPRWYLGENFGTNFPDYESEYADSVFIDLQTGDYKIISSEKGIIVP